MSNYFVKLYYDSNFQQSFEYQSLEDACESAMSQFTKYFSSKKDLKVKIFYNQTEIKELDFVECINDYDSLQRYFLNKIFN